jgi:hypothetical protein
MILANVVFPVPAGHQKSIDGIYLLSKKLDIGTSIFFCQVKSSIFCGLSRLDSGSSIVFTYFKYINFSLFKLNKKSSFC